MQNEVNKKTFRLDSKTEQQLKDLIAAEKLSSPGISVSQNSIIIDAINFYHSSKFGKDVFDQTIHKLETVIGNRVDHVIAQHTEILVDLISKTYAQALLSKEAAYLLLLSTGAMKPDIDKDVLQNLINRNQATNMMLSKAVAVRDKDER